ncbi:paxillin isoform X1 [Diachasma alloeum]|uniref:paxillin isoform X1 n=1 Tax=Diachasma alloeum TaxID=454923 RepID=UPI00073816A8|nr:paxillin isoform X1 [Diachasma alloeum]XP_015115598.1 paxillin isoform X1 [Diachasma alloeum]XP_015115604.1 paxillin isoform X1 [Diachasma alloeum]
MGHNALTEQEGNRPKWLLELENRKRKPRLAHEVGAGAPCIKCTVSCPGLDLHFWRKICKNCKCSRDDHDVPDEDFPQFDLLFGPSGVPKKKSIILKRQSAEEMYEWAPPDASKELAIDYMKALPEDKLPIKGTVGAAFRKQQLQKQLPLHDIDHKVCDELTDSERKQFEKYLENLKKYVGQGRVSKFVTARPFDRTLMTPANASECFSPKHKPAAIQGNSPNLRTPSSFVTKKYDQGSHLARDRSPMPDPTLASSKREFLSNPPFDQISSEASRLGRYHHILGDVKTDQQLAQSTNVPGIQNPAMNFPTVSRIPQDESGPLVLPGSQGMAPSSLVPHDQGLHSSRDRSPATSGPTPVSSKREFLMNPAFDQSSSEASRLGRYHHILGDVKTDQQLAQSTNVPGIQNPAMNFPTVSRIPQDESGPLVLPGSQGMAPSSLVPHDQGLHSSRDRSPATSGPTPVSSKREFLMNPAFDQSSSEASRLGRYHHILGDVKTDQQLAQSTNVPGIQNPAMNFPTVSRIPQDESGPLVLPGSQGMAPSSLVPHDQGLHSSRDRSPATSGPTPVSSKREFLMNPAFDQSSSEASRLGRYHHILGDPKADQQLAQSMAVPGVQNPAMNFSTVNGIPQGQICPSIPPEPELGGIRAAAGAHSDALNGPMNTALHFAQSNLYSETPGTTNSLPCRSQFQRIGAVKADHAVNDNKPLRSHQWAKKLDKFTRQPSVRDDNSTLADQMLSEALLPPSSIHSNDIIASTLDEKGLSYIREKLSSKYGEKEDSADVQSQIPMTSKDLESGAALRDSRVTDSNTKPVASQLLSYGGVNPSIIHSVSQNNPVFPEAAVGTVRTMEHPRINRLGSEMENMRIYPPKQKCHQCTEDIVIGDVIVTAEQAKDAAWHPGCFVCSVCDELLVDLVYFYHKGKLYCGRDFAGLLEIPRCFACDELIFVREYTIAEGHNYHVKHFCCWDCDEPLAGKQYISESDRPLCLPCYQKTYAKTCSACQKVIAAHQQGVAVKNLDFHASEECFCCANCKKSLLNGRMAIKENKPFCSKECITTFLNKF